MEKNERGEEVPPVQTQHEIKVGDELLKYTATTGMMPLKNDQSGEVEANMFFIAYTLDNVEDTRSRPLTFVLNGGPGSPLFWLLLGPLGSKRINIDEEGLIASPPYRLLDNEYTWLDQTDLVILDPIGVGYSRAVNADDNKNYWNVQGDIESVGKFIRLYLTRYERWTSRLFLAGLSYGTFRAAGLAGYLIDRGIAFSGIVLISSILNTQTVWSDDLPYWIYLPSYAATAWYHGKLPQDLQEKPLVELLDEVEQWAIGDYNVALAKGDKLPEAEYTEILTKLARYSGLKEDYIDKTNIRIQHHRFCKELLRDEKHTIGRVDSRIKGRDALSVTERYEYDPSFMNLKPIFTSTFKDYARRDLGYKTDITYTVTNNIFQQWEFSRNSYADTSEALRSAMAKNPFMKVFVAQGYYDLATPYFGAEYSLSHMGRDSLIRDNITAGYYEAGHMFYHQLKSMEKFRRDIMDFMNNALSYK